MNFVTNYCSNASKTYRLDSEDGVAMRFAASITTIPFLCFCVVIHAIVFPYLAGLKEAFATIWKLDALEKQRI